MNLRDKLKFWMALSNYVDMIVRGTSPLSLPDAIANSLSYVKAFGGTQQGEVPQGYTRLTNITNSSAGYLDTGIIADVDDIEFDVVAKINGAAPVSWYILQSRASSGAPIYGISGSASGNTFIGSFSGTNVSGGTTVVRQSGHTYHVNVKCKNGTITLTVEDLTDSTSTTNTGTYTFAAGTTNLGLFSNLSSGNLSSGNTSVISAYVKKGGVKVLDYVPALNPSNVVGFYDKATGTFKVSTGGAFVADQTIVPTPTAPMDIISNNGALKVSKNLFNSTTRITGYYISAEGVPTENSDSYYSALIPVQPNTYYTYSGRAYGGNKRLHAYDASGNWIQQINYASVSASTQQVAFDVSGQTPANCKYVRISGASADANVQLEQGSTVTPYRPYGQIYTDGTVETIKDTIGNTATAEMLLKVGDYQDEQEILSGAVTRNVGIKVLTGAADEQWSTSVSTKFYWDTDFAKALNYSPTLCTHYQAVLTDRTSGVGNNQIALFVNYSKGRIVICDPRFTTVSDFKAFLADQYAAGTPVIVVYPLATPTTESVTGQTLQVTSGDNVLEITQASLDNLQLEASYKKAA